MIALAIPFRDRLRPIWRGLNVALLILFALAGPAAGTEAVRILALGDSLTHGYGLATADTFPVRLEAALAARGYAVEVINGGNSGDTTAAGLARLDWALADRPDLVIVELGANDGLRGLDPAETYANLDAVLTRLAERELPVLLTGMRAPRNLGRAYVEEFDSVFPRLAAEHGVAFYPFFLDGVAMEPALNQPDGIHPNPDGVAEIVARILPHVTPLLDTLTQGSAGATGASGADG